MNKMNFSENWTFWYSHAPEQKQTVTLPHDAMITDRRGPDAPSGCPGGYFYGDLYVYEKTFDVPADWAEQTVTLEFEASYQWTTVFVNGKKACFHSYGYTPFFVCLDEYLKYGELNDIRVEVDNSKQKNSRWYSGGGLYRPVNLYVQPKTRIALEGVRVFTEELGPAVCACGTKREYGTVRVLTEVAGNDGSELTPSVTLLEGETVLVEGTGKDVLLKVNNIKTWSAEKPNLYTCLVELKHADGTVVDSVTEPFGFRTLDWTPKGFFVNGKSVKLRGGCVHHDNGIVGCAAYEEAEYRKVRILKEQGYNAIRSAHNPCSKAMLNACDELGMYLLDEAFDMWYTHKSPYDNATYFEESGMEDMLSMVRRDVNHPSVIGYSLVNEPSELSSKKGQGILRKAYKNIKAIDPSRPVTAGVNLLLATVAVAGVDVGYNGKSKEATEATFDENGNAVVEREELKILNGSLMFNKAFQLMGPYMNILPANPLTDKITTPIFAELDMAGYNYGYGRYRKEGKKHPERLLYGSETLPMDIYKNWNMVEKNDNICGDFMWTAWDYLGEVGCGGWSYENDGVMMNKDYPWMLAGAGAIDILGNPGCESAYAGVVWKQQSDPQLFVRPVNHPGVKPLETMWRGSNAVESWAWKDCEGNDAHVEVYTRADYVELWLNGSCVGQATPKKDIATFHVPYAPGELKARAIRGGVCVGEAVLRSAEPKLQLTLTPEFADGRNIFEAAKPGELVFVHVDVTDATGVVESNADSVVTVNVDGGELVAFGSAILSSDYRYHTGTFPTYYGRALAVIRAGESGPVNVSATSESGLEGTVEIAVE